MFFEIVSVCECRPPPVATDRTCGLCLLFPALSFAAYRASQTAVYHTPLVWFGLLLLDGHAIIEGRCRLQVPPSCRRVDRQEDRQAETIPPNAVFKLQMAIIHVFFCPRCWFTGAQEVANEELEFAGEGLRDPSETGGGHLFNRGYVVIKGDAVFRQGVSKTDVRKASLDVTFFVH